MKKLTVSIATRGRPQLLDETLRAGFKCVLPDTRIHVAIDEDDEATRAYLNRLPGGGRYIYSVKPREDTRGLKHQRVLTEAPADLYLVGTDTTPITTVGFDKIFLETAAEFPDGIGVVSTPMANVSFPYLQAVTAKWVELTGHVQPPHFPYWFIDNWTDAVAKMAGRYWMADVDVNSNAHPQKTIGMHELPFWAAYYIALEGERVEQALRIIEALEEPVWRKDMLRSNIQRVTAWDRHLNDGVLRQGQQLEAQRTAETAPPWAGYLRAKERALAQMRGWLEDKRAAA